MSAGSTQDAGAADPLLGTKVGNYEVREKLGEGGMGSVYLAVHPRIGKKVALKVLHPEFSSNEDVVGRFFNEAKAVNDIQHPNIVDIIDYGTMPSPAGGQPVVYFIMEFLAGKSLADILHEQSPLPVERARVIAQQIADALSASHKHGIVHRDLKPDNVMISQRRDGRDAIKVLDFGIAKLTGDQPGSSRTRTGIVMGTPAYMSPEQCEGRGHIDHRTDVYALGILLYEMLSGQVPFRGEGYGEVLVQHMTQVPLSPSSIHAGISPHLEAVCMRMLEKRPDARFSSMDEVVEALNDPTAFVESRGGIAGFVSYYGLANQTPYPGYGSAMMPAYATPPPGMVPPRPGTGPISPLTPAPGQLSTPGSGIYPANPASGTMPPSAVDSASAKKGKGPLIAVGAVVVVGAIVAIVAATMGGGEPAAEPEVAVAPAVLPADAAPAVEVAPEPVELTVSIVSEPKGAAIFIAGRAMGKTPKQVTLTQGEAVPLRLELKGFVDYRDENFTPTESGVKDFALVPVTKPVDPAVAKAEKEAKAAKDEADRQKARKRRERKKTQPDKVGSGTLAPEGF